MSKKEEQLLSPEDHERLAAAALESDFRGRWAFCTLNGANSGVEVLFVCLHVAGHVMTSRSHEF